MEVVLVEVEGVDPFSFPLVLAASGVALEGGWLEFSVVAVLFSEPVAPGLDVSMLPVEFLDTSSLYFLNYIVILIFLNN